MRKMRLFSIFALIALLLASPAFATGDSEDAGSGSDMERVTLRFYFFGNSREKVPEVYEAISEQYEAELNADFEVNFIPGGDYRQRIVALAASGDDYDMNFDGNWLVFDQMSSRGAYMDITDLLPEYAPGLYSVYEDLGVLEAASVDGRVVGLPWTMSMNQRPYFGWNREAAAEAGVSVDSVETMEDIDALMAELYDYYEGEGIEMMGPVNREVILLMGEYVDLNFHNLVYSINDDNPTVIPLEQTPEYLEAAQWAKRWNEAGYILADSVLETVNGNTLLGESLRLSHFTWHEWRNNLGKVVGGADSSELYPSNQFANRTPLANVAAINANAANPERALMFLDLVETDRQMYDLFHYGIEGTTYNLTPDGAAEYAVEGMTQANSNYMEWGGQWAFWKPQFMRPNATYGPGFWEEEARLAALPKNVNAPLSGFFPKSDNITNELAARDQIWQFDKEIRYGAFDMTAEEAVAQMIEQQQTAGIDVIVADVQAQIDAYMASR